MICAPALEHVVEAALTYWWDVEARSHSRGQARRHQRGVHREPVRVATDV
jgi:hypothetical protein